MRSCLAMRAARGHLAVSSLRQDMLARNSTDSPERLFVEALSTDWVFSCKVADDSFDVSLKRKPSDRNDVLGLGLTDP